MDIFKGQGNDILKKLCSGNRCEIEIVPHNLTNKFQPLDLTINNAAKAFIQNHYNDWLSNQVAHQLKRGKDQANIKISSKLSDLKRLHAGWIVNLQNRMQGECKTIVMGTIVNQIFNRTKSLVGQNFSLDIILLTSPKFSHFCLPKFCSIRYTTLRATTTDIQWILRGVNPTNTSQKTFNDSSTASKTSLSILKTFVNGTKVLLIINLVIKLWLISW